MSYSPYNPEYLREMDIPTKETLQMFGTPQPNNPNNVPNVPNNQVPVPMPTTTGYSGKLLAGVAAGAALAGLMGGYVLGVTAQSREISREIKALKRESDKDAPDFKKLLARADAFEKKHGAALDGLQSIIVDAKNAISAEDLGSLKLLLEELTRSSKDNEQATSLPVPAGKTTQLTEAPTHP